MFNVQEKDNMDVTLYVCIRLRAQKTGPSKKKFYDRKFRADVRNSEISELFTHFSSYFLYESNFYNFDNTFAPIQCLFLLLFIEKFNFFLKLFDIFRTNLIKYSKFRGPRNPRFLNRARPNVFQRDRRHFRVRSVPGGHSRRGPFEGNTISIWTQYKYNVCVCSLANFRLHIKTHTHTVSTVSLLIPRLQLTFHGALNVHVEHCLCNAQIFKVFK